MISKPPRLRPRLALIVLAVAVLTCGCDAAVQAVRDAVLDSPAAHALPASSKSTWRADQERQKAWSDEVLVSSHRRVGKRDPRWNAAAEAFIRASTPALVGMSSPGTPELVSRARELLGLGADDPVLLYFAARAIRGHDPRSREASELFERAVAGMHEVPYPRAIARLVASGLRSDYDDRNEGTGKRQVLDPVELRWFLESLGDGSYGSDDDVVLVWHLSFGTGPSLFNRNRAAIDQALSSTPWVDPWVRGLITGRRHVRDAWTSRGAEYASKVTEEGSKGFAESLDRARAALTESWRARPDRPEAAAQMISVALGGRAGAGETVRTWFDRAVAAQFDYIRAYEGLIGALRWRWSGDRQALPRFARECYETRRFDTDVPIMAFDAIEQMERDLREESGIDLVEAADGPVEGEPPSPYRDEAIYAVVTAVLDGYLRDQSRQLDYVRFQSLYAAVDYKAGRYAAAREHLRQADSRLTENAQRAIGHRLPAGRIEAFGGEHGADAVRADELYRAGRIEEARPLFEKARSGATPAAREYVDHRLAAIAVERELGEGRAVRFLPGPDLAGWTMLFGQWRVEPDGSLVGTSESRGLMINCEARVGPDFEAEADIEIVSTTNGQFQAGITFGQRPDFWTTKWTSFRIKRTAHEGQIAYFARGFDAPRRTAPMPIPERGHVVVQSWNGKLAAYVNGTAAAADYAPEWELFRGRSGQVGFGGYVNDNTFVVRYRNVRLKRLAAPPPPPPSR